MIKKNDLWFEKIWTIYFNNIKIQFIQQKIKDMNWNKWKVIIFEKKYTIEKITKKTIN